MTKPNDFEIAAEAAAADADQDLAEESERFAPPSWTQISAMLPEPRDQEELQRLMQIVQGETAHNEKVAALLQNIDGVAGAVVKILEGFQ